MFYEAGVKWYTEFNMANSFHITAAAVRTYLLTTLRSGTIHQSETVQRWVKNASLHTSLGEHNPSVGDSSETGLERTSSHKPLRTQSVSRRQFRDGFRTHLFTRASENIHYKNWTGRKLRSLFKSATSAVGLGGSEPRPLSDWAAVYKTYAQCQI